mmetsp:Transcript_15817/g.48972  ORF Transcript_15817/g.48972 Transcript_15817/m.48972 type:complete len:307 (-) Transcript_15817:3-923(-)
MAPRTVRFEARDVFNLPLSEGFLVLDARGDDAYERAHLSGAWRLTPDLDELLRIVDDENPPEQLSTVLVCAAPGDGDGVARRLLEALGDGVLEAPDDAVHQPPDDAEDAFPSLRSRLARRLERVAFFEETEGFVESFPFLAVSGPEPLVEAPPVLPALLVAPTAETGALYLGSQTHALSGEGLEILRVGAIVNATEEVRFHEAPRARLRCPLRDDETCDLTDAFAASHAFLAEHRNQGVHCLVHCSRGRNRSAALAAHHLLRSGAVRTPAEAIAFLRECRPMSLQNENFVSQIAGGAHMINECRVH